MFAALARRHGGQLSREQTVALLASAGLGEGGEHVELLWSEMGLAPDAFITQVRKRSRHSLCAWGPVPSDKPEEDEHWLLASHCTVLS